MNPITKAIRDWTSVDSSILELLTIRTYKVAFEEVFSTVIDNIFMMLMMTNLLSLLFAIEIMFIGNSYCHGKVRYKVYTR